jgi:hypothetical protein
MNDNAWVDVGMPHGRFGLLVAIGGMIFVGHLVFIGATYILWPNSFNNLVFAMLAQIYFVVWFILQVASFLYSIKTIRVAALYSGRVSGDCYYLRKFNIEFADIALISDIKPDLIKRGLKLFSGDGQGFYIKLRNGRKYYISPNLVGLDSFRAVLLKEMVECKTELEHPYSAQRSESGSNSLKFQLE